MESKWSSSGGVGECKIQHRTDTQLQDVPGVVTPQQTSNMPESFADMSIGRAPIVDQEAIASLLHGENLLAVQRVIAHHESQCRRLCTAGQLLRDVRSEVHDTRKDLEVVSSTSSPTPFAPSWMATKQWRTWEVLSPQEQLWSLEKRVSLSQRDNGLLAI